MTVVEFFYDIISPFSRFQYELLMRQIGHWKSMELKMTPVSIRKIFEASSNPPPGLNPTKAAYLFTELMILSDYHKIPFQLPPDFMQIAMERGTNKTQQFLLTMQNQIDQEKYHRLIGEFFAKFFSPTDHQNVCEVDIMKTVASKMGIDQAMIEKAVEAIDKPETVADFQKNSDRAIELGGFGLPMTMVHSKDPKWVFGSDRMHIIGYLLDEKEPPILR